MGVGEKSKGKVVVEDSTHPRVGSGFSNQSPTLKRLTVLLNTPFSSKNLNLNLNNDFIAIHSYLIYIGICYPAPRAHYFNQSIFDVGGQIFNI